MRNKFFKKIIARSSDDLQFISAYCSNSSVKINDIKYLKKNKIFLILLERINQDKKNQKISSILKFEFVDSSNIINCGSLNNALLIPIRCICPPESFAAFSPTIVSSLFGNVKTKSFKLD